MFSMTYLLTGKDGGNGVMAVNRWYLTTSRWKSRRGNMGLIKRITYNSVLIFTGHAIVQGKKHSHIEMGKVTFIVIYWREYEEITEELC